MFTIYQAKLPNGSIYIGRTAKLWKRIKSHKRNAKKGSKAPLHVHIRNGDQIEWTILAKVETYSESMTLETKFILEARDRGEMLLNITRGGYYDRYDNLNGIRLSMKKV